MALVQLPDTKGKKVPDSSGWYWLKVGQLGWAPILVDQKADSIPTVHWAHSIIEVGDIDGEWGPQIFPPK